MANTYNHQGNILTSQSTTPRIVLFDPFSEDRFKTFAVASFFSDSNAKVIVTVLRRSVASRPWFSFSF
jgi:hypothetical protein